jgi:uncharacterized protein (DUF1697 family)
MHETTFIALLRGINVGGQVLKMADLKAAVADLGFGAIETYLQSGNMVFRAPAAGSDGHAARISSAIRAHTGMDVAVMTRSAADWEAMIARNPFAEAAAIAPKTLHAFTLGAEPDKSRLDAVRSSDFGNEHWQIVDRTLYLSTPDGFGKSKLGGSIERRLNVAMTARNWTTVLALRDLASACG